MSSWSWSEIVEAVRGTSFNSDHREVLNGIFTDTRHTIEGGLFVPLVGERFDGHNFALQALERGAGAILWAREEIPADLASAPIVRVADTLEAYQALGAHNLKRLGIPAVAITGSVGKTTTKDLVRSLLSHKFKVHATPVNHNNDIGVANTLLELDETHEIAVIEMGMRGAGQIERLARLVDARVGVITTIGESHLEILGTREAIAEAKAELFEQMGKGSLAIYPSDSPYSDILRSHIRGRSCSFSMSGNSKAEWRLIDYRPEVTERGLGSRIRFAYPGGELELYFARPGVHNSSNLLAALAVCSEFGLSPEELREEIATFRPIGSRAEIRQLPEGITLIDDAYNAAPSSMRGALEIMSQIASYRGVERLEQRRRCVAVLGDMLELGTDTDEFHRQIGKACADYGVDLLIGVGDISGRTLVSVAKEAGIEVLVASDREEAWELLCQNMRPGDVVLVKASHSIGLEYIGSRLAENNDL